MNNFYVTTAIAYASKKPHFGNTYEAIMTDAVARYKRARGYDVFFCTGTDEHGQKIENLANDAKITVRRSKISRTMPRSRPRHTLTELPERFALFGTR